mmetsp:Transcript_34722/g.45908  ORF Transcript_34722/g.45908 Transcript_34722/m.45908 type:complete len:238 (+) Transcript_34722:42-755(+)
MQEAKILVGPRVHARSDRPHPCYFEITFLSDSANSGRYTFAGLTFQNYFCAHISIKQLQKTPKKGAESPGSSLDNSGNLKQLAEDDGGNGNQWITILPYRHLMKNAHHETDAQNWHAITVEEFNSNYKANNLPLRIYLNQPSPLWLKVDVKEVKCYMKPLSGNPVLPPSPPLSGLRKGLSFTQQKRTHRTSPRNLEGNAEKNESPISDVTSNIRRRFQVLKGSQRQRNLQSASSSGY